MVRRNQSGSIHLLFLTFLLIASPNSLKGQQRDSTSSNARTTGMASGSFVVTLNPMEAYNSEPSAKTGRMSIDKVFEGDLAGTSKGEMLTGMTAQEGSGAYVAIERYTGSLKGRRGSFTLQHSGIMIRGTPQLNISVIPDSGTEELTGLRGTMSISIVEKRHFYSFEYTLPDEKIDRHDR